MIQFVKIERNAEIKIEKFKEINDLYKKCGFRKKEDFHLIHCWEFNTDFIEIWGKTTGKSNLKNNYLFPSPIEQTIFGNCCILKKNSSDIYIDFNLCNWDNFLFNYKKNKENLEKKNIIELSESDSSEDECNSINSELKEESYIYSSEEES